MSDDERPLRYPHQAPRHSLIRRGYDDYERAIDAADGDLSDAGVSAARAALDQLTAEALTLYRRLRAAEPPFDAAALRRDEHRLFELWGAALVERARAAGDERRALGRRGATW